MKKKLIIIISSIVLAFSIVFTIVLININKKQELYMLSFDNESKLSFGEFNYVVLEDDKYEFVNMKYTIKYSKGEELLNILKNNEYFYMEKDDILFFLKDGYFYYIYYYGSGLEIYSFLSFDSMVPFFLGWDMQGLNGGYYYAGEDSSYFGKEYNYDQDGFWGYEYKYSELIYKDKYYYYGREKSNNFFEIKSKEDIIDFYSKINNRYWKYENDIIYLKGTFSYKRELPTSSNYELRIEFLEDGFLIRSNN